MKNKRLYFSGAIIFSAILSSTISSYADTFPSLNPLEMSDRFKKLKTEEVEVAAGSAATLGATLDERLERLSGPLQHVAAQRSFTGDVAGAIEAFDLFEQLADKKYTISNQDNLRMQDAKAEDAIESILNEARKRQVVILNEAHHVPLHRAFAMKLARELRKIGYEYLACETFESPIPLIDGQVSKLTGYYSNEPVFANFLRDAQKDNWKFVQYEPMDIDSELPDDQYMRLREIGQANNLIQRIFKKTPKAKVFIYVGYWHATKLPLDKKDTDFGWMAEQLKLQAGIDALSIDQTMMYSHSNLKAEYPLYRAALKKDKTGKAFILKSSKKEYQVFGSYEGRVDMQVVHPSYGLNVENKRADWLSLVAGLTPQDIPKDILPTTGRRLIYAFDLHASEDVVPADVILVEAGKPIPKLMLPAGEFRFLYED